MVTGQENSTCRDLERFKRRSTGRVTAQRRGTSGCMGGALVRVRSMVASYPAQDVCLKKRYDMHM
jgi:hypothetical protein